MNNHPRKSLRQSAWQRRLPAIYCPVCQQFILAVNHEAVRQGTQRYLVFVHTSRHHQDSDFEALTVPIQ